MAARGAKGAARSGGVRAGSIGGRDGCVGEEVGVRAVMTCSAAATLHKMSKGEVGGGGCMVGGVRCIGGEGEWESGGGRTGRESRDGSLEAGETRVWLLNGSTWKLERKSSAEVGMGMCGGVTHGELFSGRLEAT